MNDRFKFRAWDKFNKKWHEASLRPDGWDRMDVISPEGSICDWQQCAGLKDKNGKLIYEGDIVSNEHVNLKIIWVRGCFYAGEQLGIRLSEVADVYSVIGNIYENPELLNQLKK